MRWGLIETLYFMLLSPCFACRCSACCFQSFCSWEYSPSTLGSYTMTCFQSRLTSLVPACGHITMMPASLCRDGKHDLSREHHVLRVSSVQSAGNSHCSLLILDFALAWRPSVMCVKLCPTGTTIQCTLVEFTCAC